MSGKEDQYEDATSSIEHILPENPASIWDSNFPADEQIDFIYRIGNYTLLEVSINNKLANDFPFPKKVEAYKTSKYKMTNEHLAYNEWNPSTLSLHQQQMAKWAKAIWKSSYL